MQSSDANTGKVLAFQVRGGVDSGYECVEKAHRQVMAAFQQYRDQVFRYVCSILHDPGEAEDVTQDVFLKLFEELCSSRRIENRPWLFRVAHNAAIDMVRGKRPEAEIAAAQQRDSLSAALHTKGNFDEDLVAEEQRRQFYESLDVLSPQERQCIHLRLEGLCYREIADVLGLRLPSVQKYLGRAVSKITRKLEK